MSSSITWLFPPFRLDTDIERLSRDGETIALRPRTFAVLCCLVERHGQLIDKNQLLDAVWGHRHVSESVLEGCISELRKGLDDDAKTPRYVETVPRRGYRFIASVRRNAADDSPLNMARLRTGAYACIGREAQLQHLQDCWREAQGGERRLVMLSGEAGLGKTTLIGNLPTRSSHPILCANRCWRTRCCKPKRSQRALRNATIEASTADHADRHRWDRKTSVSMNTAETRAQCKAAYIQTFSQITGNLQGILRTRQPHLPIMVSNLRGRHRLQKCCRLVRTLPFNPGEHFMKPSLYFLAFVVPFSLTASAWAAGPTLSTLDARVTALEATVSKQQTAINSLTGTLALQNKLIDGLTASVTAQQNTISNLNSQLMSVKESPVMALNDYLDVDAPHGLPRAVFSGINLQVVNGTGKTDSANGLGNLILGYDEARNRDVTRFSSCSKGDFNNQIDCEAHQGVWAISHKSGSHYLVIGPYHNYSGYAGMVVGYFSSSRNSYASVSGGYSNTANGKYSSVSGGFYNYAIGEGASITGGVYNLASGMQSSVSGGSDNAATGASSSVSGGAANDAIQSASSVSGGYSRKATGSYNWAAGGLFQSQ